MSTPLLNVSGAKISFKIGARVADPIDAGEQTKPAAAEIVRKSKEGKRERKVRSTSFNVTDPLERQLDAHADRFSCFSTYVKRLIHEDFVRGHTSASSAPSETRYYDVMASNVAAAIGRGK